LKHHKILGENFAIDLMGTHTQTPKNGKIDLKFGESNGENSFTYIIGDNGCGKSSLLKTLFHLISYGKNGNELLGEEKFTTSRAYLLNVFEGYLQQNHKNVSSSLKTNLVDKDKKCLEINLENSISQVLYNDSSFGNNLVYSTSPEMYSYGRDQGIHSTKYLFLQLFANCKDQKASFNQDIFNKVLPGINKIELIVKKQNIVILQYFIFASENEPWINEVILADMTVNKESFLGTQKKFLSDSGQDSKKLEDLFHVAITKFENTNFKREIEIRHNIKGLRDIISSRSFIEFVKLIIQNDGIFKLPIDLIDNDKIKGIDIRVLGILEELGFLETEVRLIAGSNRSSYRQYSIDHISSGENQRLRFYCMLQNRPKAETENLLFIFDEPENSLHIKWQYSFVNDLKEVLKHFDIKNSHFIISSHSPMLLMGGKKSQANHSKFISLHRNRNSEGIEEVLCNEIEDVNAFAMEELAQDAFGFDYRPPFVHQKLLAELTGLDGHSCTKSRFIVNVAEDQMELFEKHLSEQKIEVYSCKYDREITDVLTRTDLSRKINKLVASLNSEQDS